MRRILIGIIAAALLGALACSSNENGTASLSGPSAVPTIGTSGPLGADEKECNNNQCEFNAASLGSESGQWHGNTTPTALPSKGHPGHVTITFAAPFWGAKLSWTGMHHGRPAECAIWDDLGNKVKELPDDCGDKGEGFLVVYPTRTTTYTIKNKASAAGSQSPTWVKSVTVALPTSISTDATVTWKPLDQYRADDLILNPSLNYTGKATGSLSEIQVSGAAPTRCGLGGGATYSHLHAVMTLIVVDGVPKLKTHYTGVTDVQDVCSAAEGDVDLIIDDGTPMPGE